MKPLKRKIFKPPSFETISSTLNGCKVPSVVDISNCYWHQTLTVESPFLCVFNSPFDRYRLRECHLVFHAQVKWPRKWLKNIFAIFQVHYQFSMITSSEVEMNKNIISSHAREQEHNIKFNRDKIQFRVNKGKYMGEVVSELEFSPDPDKISAIHNVPTPSCEQDLQRLLGMINYLAKHIPKMPELTASCYFYLSLT